MASPKWGVDLQSEHERYLTEKYARKPVVVMNYPKAIKTFHLRVPYRRAADPPWMKPDTCCCPGENRDPYFCRPRRGKVDPGFRQGSAQRF